MKLLLSPVALLCLLPNLFAGEAPKFRASDYPSDKYTVTERRVTKNGVRLTAKQVRPKVGDEPFFCRAWVNVEHNGRKVAEVSFSDIDPVASHFGLFIPIKQPLEQFLVVLKFGDYDGRLLLIDRSGKLTNLKGGWFFVDSRSGLLFSEYASDQPEVVVFDLKTRQSIFEAEIPHNAGWYTDGKDYFVWPEDDEVKDSKGTTTLIRIDVQNRKASPTTVSTQLFDSSFRRVSAPFQSEFKDFSDCAFR